MAVDRGNDQGPETALHERERRPEQRIWRSTVGTGRFDSVGQRTCQGACPVGQGESASCRDTGCCNSASVIHDGAICSSTGLTSGRP
jgi:hypothetical protein